MVIDRGIRKNALVPGLDSPPKERYGYREDFTAQVKEGGVGTQRTASKIDWNSMIGSNRIRPTVIRRIIVFLMIIHLSDSPSSVRINLSETIRSDSSNSSYSTWSGIIRYLNFIGIYRIENYQKKNFLWWNCIHSEHRTCRILLKSSSSAHWIRPFLITYIRQKSFIFGNQMQTEKAATC